MSALGGSTFAIFTPAAASYGAGHTLATAQQFTGVGANGGGEAMITTAVLEIDGTALQSGEGDYFLELYSVTPPSAYVDNTAWDLPSGDRAYHVATIDLGTPVDKGSTLKVITAGINQQVSVGNGGSLWGYLVTEAGFTATTDARKVTIHTVPL